MAYGRQIALPSPKSERSLSYERLSGGLNLWELDYRLRRSESPEMMNLIWRDGTLNCRDGQLWLNGTARGKGLAMADRPFHGCLVFHAGSKLYAYDLQEKTVSVLKTGLTQQAGSFFIHNESLFYKNRGGYVAVSAQEGGGLAAAAVPAYTPVTVINADPGSGAGDLYQPENRLSPNKTVWYNAQSGVTVYHLPVGNVDGVEEVTVDGVSLAASAYTLDASAGTLTFASAPPVTDPPTNNTVHITYAKANAEAYNSVMSCSCAAVCGGGTGSLCVVLGGSESQPNAYFWNGSHAVMDPGYFPMLQYQLAGDSSEAITGFGKQQSYLIVFKTDSLGRTAVSETTLDGRSLLEMPYVPINSELGCDLPQTIRLVENNLVWAHSRHGALRLYDSSAAYENNVRCISRKINGGDDMRKGLLWDLKQGTACACDDGHRYLVAANGHAWVWDYELSEPGDPSWFYWTDIDARAFSLDGEKLCHLDGSGRLSVFARVYADYGEGIEKVYRFATEHFGSYDRLKNVNSVILAVRSDTNASASLRYITDCGQREDPTELRAWSWLLSPRNLSFRALNGRRFAMIFRRRCACRGVKHFTMRLSNSARGQDLSVVSAQVFYNEQGRQR
ncbi:MAG: hypothetical protein IK149_03260 [Oscillospiraceae bacterium]|nr:hypothetical protein [Oscillospiraceae bacterium]